MTKESQLIGSLRRLGRVVVAYSGPPPELQSIRIGKYNLQYFGLKSRFPDLVHASTPDEVQTPEMLTELESYYDTAPRAGATTVDVGPFTLFLKTDPDGWEYYGRPRLGLEEPVTRIEARAPPA